MIGSYKYLAFISYKREDEKWAKWLQYQLEHYKLPTSVRKSNPFLPERVRPIFKDTTDLAGGVLEKALKDALNAAKFLIVVCSPRATQSPWICKEVQEFIDSGREEFIIPFIIDGEPNSLNLATECFPKNLRDLSGSRELLGININEMGREAAVIKVVARMFSLRFDILWQRWEREQKKRRRLIVILTILGGFIVLVVAAVMFFQSYKIREKLAREVAYRAEKLIDEGDSYLARKLLIEVLPDKNDILPYPYTTEAEAAFRRACVERWCTIKSKNFDSFDGDITNIEFSNDAKLVLLTKQERIDSRSYSDDKIYELYNIESGEFLELFYDNAIFSPNGKYILKISNGRMMLWSVEARDYLYVCGDEALNCHSATFSTDGKYIVSVSKLGMVNLWTFENDNCIFESYIGEIENVARNYSIKFSSDGKYITYVTSKNNRFLEKDEEIVKIWSVDTRELLNTICISHEQEIDEIEFTCNMEYIITHSISWNRTKIWSIRTGECLKTVENVAVALSSDGKHIVSASENKPLELWSIETGECQTFDCSANYATFSPDGKYIVSSSENELFLWSVETLGFLQKIKGSGPVIFSSNGEYIVSESNGDYIIWSIDSGKCENIKNDGNSYVKKFSPDGQYIAFIDGGQAKLLNVEDKECHKVLELDEMLHELNFRTIPAYFVTFSPDGKYILSIHEGIRIWDVKSGECIKYIGTDDFTNEAKITPDGKFVVSAPYSDGFSRNDTAIKLWSIKTGECLHMFEGHTSNIYSVECSPDGKYVVSASGDKTIKLWSLVTRRCLHTFKGHISDVYSVAFSPDGKFIVSASKDKTVKLWSTETKTCVKTIRLFESVKEVRFSKDGENILFVNGDYSVGLYSVTKNKVSHSFNNKHPSLRIVSAFTSNDGQYIISTGDYSVVLWDIDSGKRVYTYKEQNGAVHCVASSPDGKSFASASADGTIRLWSYQSLQELIEETKMRFKDNALTSKERRDYYLN